MTTLAHTSNLSVLRAQERAQFPLTEGSVLVVASDENGSADVTWLGERAGDAAQQGWSLGASSTQVVGPYAMQAQIEVYCICEGVTVEIGVPDSVSMPSGGAAGDVLTKNSTANFDAAWATPATWAVPQMTTEEREALDPQPGKGTLIYNTSTDKLNLMGATDWEVVTSSLPE